jgi:hypothetical protein
MIIFLDFDGVLHPFLERSGAKAFCYMPRLEKVLREFPSVQIVITSTQREFVPLPLLKEQFASDIAARIVGTTPVHQIRDAGDVASSRHREILAYLDGSGTDWLALDDDVSLFPLGCAELVLCEDGFRDPEERVLRAALETLERKQVPTSGLCAYFVLLAKRHGVTYTKTPCDQLAEVITNLSDDDVEMDEVELLLIALERAGIVPSEQVVALHVNYLREKLK